MYMYIYMYMYTCIWRCLFCISQYKYDQQWYRVDVFFFSLGWPIRSQGAHEGPALGPTQ